MNFEDALTCVKQGGRVRRELWERGVNDLVGTQLELVHFDDYQGIEVMPMLMIRRTNENPLTWRPFSGANWDLLAEDWEEVQ